MRKFSIVSILFMLVGFAAINSELIINGSLNVAENTADFKIEISNLKINSNQELNSISNDKQSFSFTGTGNDKIEYTVTNNSYQYDASISLDCTPNNNIQIEQVNQIEAQNRIKKNITSTSQDTITCKIQIDKISRTEYALDRCKALIGTEWTYDYTGSEQEFEAECDGNYKVELWGAQGGSEDGFGAYTSGELTLMSQNELFLYVGGQGVMATTGSSNNLGGFNGGGNGGKGTYTGGGGGSGGGGGGATDIRKSKGNWDNFESLKTRIMVASGGSGARGLSNDSGGSASPGIGLYDEYTGESQNTAYFAGTKGGHGTQTSYGIGGFGNQQSGYEQILQGGNGSLGKGGTGKETSYSGGGGGGGSGYYGGGAGGSSINGIGAPGGGGSSFISGHQGCDAIKETSTESNIVHTSQPNHYSGYIFKNTKMIDGAGYNWTTEKGEYTGMPSHDGTTTMTGNAGNGYAKITYLGK